MTEETSRFADALARFHYTRDRLNNSPSNIAEEEEQVLSLAYSQADDELITTPAASVSDLRAKMEVVFEDNAATPKPETILAIMKDLHALTDYEPSRAFRADPWLKWFERWGGGWVEREGEIILMIPDDANGEKVMSDIMHSLNACDGRGAVWQLINERCRQKRAA